MEAKFKHWYSDVSFRKTGWKGEWDKLLFTLTDRMDHTFKHNTIFFQRKRLEHVL